MIVSFVLWTIIAKFVDVKQIGPNNSYVGLSTMNSFVHNLTGCNMLLYTITDWLGIVPIILVLVFGIIGLIQWIKRRNFLKVDYDILILGLYYIVVFIFYILFENVVVNYRPVLIDGYLEVSYPSSTTLIVLSVMPTIIIQVNIRINNIILKKVLIYCIIVFSCFMVVGRILSGVHWISDIIGGLLLSSGLVIMYDYLIKIKYYIGLCFVL
ncbi:MAG: phosphatase PAP2 family protein [Erysipelotrichaceae bacterium]|nr:phosphatase PAP2 family protein [Erysipelotrichaceae bacterium]